MKPSKATAPRAAGTPGRTSRTRRKAAGREACHAFVGGWAQRRGDFTSLLLGIREGRRRKLNYIGEVKTDTNGLVINLLEERLREGEVEDSPFVEDVPQHPEHKHHWITPDLVAEIDFNGWTGDTVLSGPSLRSVSERSAFRHPRWVKPPEQ
jgi:bifunctional non-homologous end joining protein LigD